MNKTIALTAITLVAVIMGMSAFASDAMAVKPTSGHKTLICHVQVEVLAEDGETVLEEASVSINKVDNASVQKHLDHDNDGDGFADGDFVIDEDSEDQRSVDCLVTVEEEDD